MSRLPRSAVGLTAVRAEPRDDAEQVTQALPGDPLWVEEKRDGWLRVRTVYCSGLVHMAYRAAGGFAPRDAHEQEDAGAVVEEPRAGDLVTYGDGERADHVAFSLGGRRILHATSREGVGAVVDEEPESLRSRRRCVVRL